MSRWATGAAGSSGASPPGRAAPGDGVLMRLNRVRGGNVRIGSRRQTRISGKSIRYAHPVAVRLPRSIGATARNRRNGTGFSPIRRVWVVWPFSLPEAVLALTPDASLMRRARSDRIASDREISLFDSRLGQVGTMAAPARVGCLVCYRKPSCSLGTDGTRGNRQRRRSHANLHEHQ